MPGPSSITVSAYRLDALRGARRPGCGQAAAIPYLDCFCIYMLHDNVGPAADTRFDQPEDDDANWQARFGIVSWDDRREKPAFSAVREAIATANTTSAALSRDL